jgi:AcrR family transcriptional regulator
MAPPKRITRENVLDRIQTAFGETGAPSMDDMAAVAGVSRAALYGLFGSRASLLEALGADVPPSVGDRILATAGEVVAERGFGGLSLDEVAHRSGVSRATVYRLYPGKAVLFKEVAQAYLPIDEALQMMDSMADRPPNEVMATLARNLAHAGEVPLGVMRAVLFEVSGGTDGNEEFLDQVYLDVQVIIGYLERQMAAGRFRTVDPVLAMQAFFAPLMFHAVSRPMLEQYGMLNLSLDDAVHALTDGWLRAMAPPRRKAGAEKKAAEKNAPARKKARPSRG